MRKFPKVVIFLEEFKVRYKDGFDQYDIKWVTQESKLLWKRILSYAEDDIVSFLLTVDENQILEINEEFHEKEDDSLIEQSKMSLVNTFFLCYFHIVCMIFPQTGV